MTLRLPFLILLLIVAFGSNAKAQVSFARGVLITKSSVTRAGSPVTVRLASPLADAKQEQTVRKLLEQPNPFDWNMQTPLHRIASDLSTRVSFEIDRRALTDIGLTPNMTCSGDSPASKPQKASILENGTTGIVGETSAWWKSSAQSPASFQVTQPLGSKLFFVLNQLDLTIDFRSGQWMITTFESAEQSLQTRLYDITPLVSKKVSPPRLIGGGFGGGGMGGGSGSGGAGSGIGGNHFTPFDPIVESIQSHVEPEIWESLGGPATMGVISTGPKRTLAVSATTLVHWQVEAFLNQLNGVE